MRVGVDTGGTFTDLFFIERGRCHAHKVPSTPGDPSEAVLRVLAEGVGRPRPEGRAKARRKAVRPEEVIHGSTVATNTLLTLTGAKTALVATAGFEDVIEIGRQARRSLYDIFADRPRPLVSRRMRFGVDERVLPTGRAVARPSDAALRRLAASIRRAGAESVAICLLFSFANPRNERAVERALRRLGIPISSSFRILPQYREYERTSTTVVNAFVSPRMDAYLGRLQHELRGVRLRVMQSNGGMISAAAARSEAVHTILSGPAGGVVGAFAAARAAGFSRAITFDMGGTSTDVALCDGEIPTQGEAEIGGYPVRVPIIAIHTVGAGGGSIAWVDQGGALRAGPQSAGADPGPACYGRGRELTVTDANLFLGRLDPERFLGGRLKLAPDRIRAPLLSLGRRLRLPPEGTAEGIVRVANATMEKAIRVISIERGYDPRDFVLVSFGGAGGMHAAELARALAIPAVMVPRNPGVLSALGMVLSDLARELTRSVLLPVTKRDYAGIRRRFDSLVRAGRAVMARGGVPRSRIRVEPRVDLRYLGQSYELTVPFDRRFVESFHRLHRRWYGHGDSKETVELVNLRVRVLGRIDPPPVFRPLDAAGVARRGRRRSRQAVPFGRWRMVFDGKAATGRGYLREDLPAGSSFRGPAVVCEEHATTVVPPDFGCRVDRLGNLFLERAR